MGDAMGLLTFAEKKLFGRRFHARHRNALSDRSAMGRRLHLEPLEDRRLLSAGGQQIQLFDASPALFVQNQGQIADASIRYAFQGSGASGAAPASLSPVHPRPLGDGLTTTATIASSPNPSVFGEWLTFTATVSANDPGSGTPTGTVTFMDGDVPLDTENLSDGTASFTTSDLTVDSHQISVVYTGDTDFADSTSDTLTQMVNQAETTTLVEASDNPAVFGQPVTFAATVTANDPGSGTPTGSVTFMDGGVPLDTEDLSNGTASFTTSDLDLGYHSIYAVYEGDANFLDSSSDSLDQQIVAETTTAVSATPSPSMVGQWVTFTATVAPVSPGLDTPTGMVTFREGTTYLGADDLSDGAASIATANLSVGSHTITAVYEGDDYYQTSTGYVTQTVILPPFATTTSLTASLDHSMFTQRVTFTATVAPVDAPKGVNPTNEVSFVIDGGAPITVPLSLYYHRASLTISTLEAGSHVVTATYNGDNNFTISTASLTDYDVDQATTATALRSTIAAPVYGQWTTLVATAKVGTRAVKAGTVTFKDGDTPVGTVPVNTAGVAALRIATLSGGDHTITAEYSGANNYLASSTTMPLQISGPGVTRITLSTTGTIWTYGHAVTLKATVYPTYPATLKPMGTVTFSDGETVLGTADLDTTGKALLVTPILPGGNHVFTAQYNGTADLLPSSVTITHKLNQAPTTTTLTASATSVVFGQAVVFTANVAAVSPGLAMPTGTVTFKDGITTLGTVQVDSNGQAQMSVSNLKVGSHYIKVTYNTDTNFKTSAAIKTVTVTASYLTLSPSAQIQSGGMTLDSQAELAPIVTAAKQRLEAKLGSQIDAALAGLKVVVADLPGKRLGAEAGKTILIDRDAAGCGWFVDSTPLSEEEFVSSNGKQQLTAVDPHAVDRIDLLTVVEHELGHVLGFDDFDALADNLMSSTLSPGIRRNVSTIDAALVSA
jgi:hypothetical protein